MSFLDLKSSTSINISSDVVSELDVSRSFRFFNVLRDLHRRSQSISTFSFFLLTTIIDSQDRSFSRSSINKRSRNYFVEQKESASSTSATKSNIAHQTSEKSFVSDFRFDTQSQTSSFSHTNQTKDISRNMIVSELLTGCR